MRGRAYGLLALIALLGWGEAPVAQTSSATVSKPSPVVQLPYLAEFRTLRVKALPNGIAIPQESTEVTARDSEGRHMRAMTVIPGLSDQTAITHFHVFDPVAHVVFKWSFPGREATVMAIPFSGTTLQGCGSMTFGIAYANEKTREEDLGTMTILGVEARGRRITTTAEEPIGKQKKHKQQMRTIEVRSTEFWKATAPGLNGLLVREVSEDRQSDKMIRELVKFSPGEPQAAVFRPPIGYVIVNREVDGDPCLSIGEMEAPVAPEPVRP